MARNFYFGADATMASGSALFSALINEDAAAFGITEAQALEYREIDLELQEAMAAARTPTTRSPVAVARKNVAVKSMQRRASDLRGIITSTEAVSNAQLLALGLLPRSRRTRRNPPELAPRVRMVSTLGRVATIRVCDAGSGGGRSKPFAAIGAEVFSYVGEESPARPSDYKFEQLTTRTTATITLPNDVANGATIWISARWVTRRGEYSTASVPTRFSLAGGDVVARADGLRIAA